MRNIQVSEETYEKIKEQIGEDFVYELNSLQDMKGKKFYFRTVTYHQVGEVVKQIGSLVQLKNASWVADSGRFMQAIKNGELSEVEPVGDMFINIESLIDMFPWNHELPKEQK